MTNSYPQTACSRLGDLSRRHAPARHARRPAACAHGAARLGPAPAATATPSTCGTGPDGLSEKVVDDAVTQFTEVDAQAAADRRQLQGEAGHHDDQRQRVHARHHRHQGRGHRLVHARRPTSSSTCNDLGADKLADQYLDWKWKKGMHQGRQADRLPDRHRPDRAVLPPRTSSPRPGCRPSRPRSAAAMSTWDDYFAAGVELKKAAADDVHGLATSRSVFNMVVGQGTTRYVDEDERFIGDQDHIRTRLGPGGQGDARSASTPKIRPTRRTGTPASTNGTLASPDRRGLGRARHQVGRAGHLGQVAGGAGPGRAGEHRRLVPGDPEGARANPDKAFEIITLDAQPGEPGPRLHRRGAVPVDARRRTQLPALTAPDPFFGDQVDDRRLRPGRREDPGRRTRARTTRAVSAPFHDGADQRRDQGQGPGRRVERRRRRGEEDRRAARGELTCDRRARGPAAVARTPAVASGRAVPPAAAGRAGSCRTGRSTWRSRRSTCCSRSSGCSRCCSRSTWPSTAGTASARCSSSGCDQFRFLLKDDTFWLSLRNTFVIWVLSTVPMLSLALVIAALLNSAKRFTRFYRIAYFIPNVTSVVAMAIFFGAVFSTNFGLSTRSCEAVDLPTSPWLHRTRWAIKIAIAIADDLAVDRLQRDHLPRRAADDPVGDLYEAAQDRRRRPGADRSSASRVPLLRPIILFTVVVSTDQRAAELHRAAGAVRQQRRANPEHRRPGTGRR